LIESDDNLADKEDNSINREPKIKTILTFAKTTIEKNNESDVGKEKESVDDNGCRNNPANHKKLKGVNEDHDNEADESSACADDKRNNVDTISDDSYFYKNQVELQ
jgi:hypothetical protein